MFVVGSEPESNAEDAQNIFFSAAAAISAF